MNILDILGKRRSVRRFKPDPISESDLKTILEAGQMAPSACNKQSWHFIVINDESLKRTLVEHGAAVFISKAPVGILVLYDNRTQNVEYSDHIQSAAAAIQNMLIASSSLGIGACWVCQLPPKRQVRKLLNIPWHMDPIAYIVMGHPLKATSDQPRKCSLDGIISYNKFDSPDSVPPRSIGLMLRIILIKIYYLLPIRMKKMLSPFVDKNFVTKFD